MVPGLLDGLRGSRCGIGSAGFRHGKRLQVKALDLLDQGRDVEYRVVFPAGKLLVHTLKFRRLFSQPHRFFFILFQAGRDQLGEPEVREQAAGHARGKGAPRQGQQGETHEEGVVGRGPAVKGKGVQEEIRQLVAGQVVRRGDPGGEDEPVLLDPLPLGGPAQVLARPLVVGQEPEHASGHPSEDLHPDGEELLGELVVVVEGAEHEGFLGKPVVGSGRLGADRALGVADLEAVGEVERLFGEEPGRILGDEVAVGDDVIDPGQTGAPGEAEVGHLHRGRTVGEDQRPGARGEPLQVDQHVYLVGAYAFGRLAVVHAADLDEVIHRAHDAATQGSPVLAAPAESIDLEALAVVEFEQLHGEQGNRVQAEVRGQIADSDFFMPVAAGRGEHPGLGAELVLDKPAGSRELQFWVVAGGQHRQRGATRDGLLFGTSFVRHVERPDALLLPQVPQVQQDIHLVGVQGKALFQHAQGFPEFPFGLKEPSQVVERMQVQGNVFGQTNAFVA